MTKSRNLFINNQNLKKGGESNQKIKPTRVHSFHEFPWAVEVGGSRFTA